MVDVRHGERGLRLGAIVVFAAVCAGCAGDLRPRYTASERLVPSDFLAPENAGGASSGSTPVDPTIGGQGPRADTPSRTPIRTISQAEASAGVGRVDTAPGAPGVMESAPASSGASVDPGSLALVDSKVGDLNGLPIVAREFLAPLAPMLRAESARLDREQWRDMALGVIFDQIQTTLTNELMLAEARASLTDEQRTLLRVFLDRVEQDEIRSSYGSQALADERLRRGGRGGLEEAKREREELTLVRQVRQDKVVSRVQVTSRDVALEYKRRFEEFNPPNVAVFSQIQVPAGEVETIGDIEAMLLEMPFEEVAADDRNRRVNPEVELDLTGSLGETELFRSDALQEAAVGLSPGEWAGPIEVGDDLRWIYLVRIEGESQSLYDVQIQLRNDLQQRREQEESARYFQRLIERAGITVESLQILTFNLRNIAEEWYYEGDG